MDVLSELHGNLLCITEDQAAPAKRQKTEVMTEEDAFRMETVKVRMLNLILDTIKHKDDTLVNFKVQPTGVELYCELFLGTCVVKAVLQREFFTEYTPIAGHEVKVTVNLKTLASHIASCQKMDVHSMVIESGSDGRLAIKGLENGTTEKIVMDLADNYAEAIDELAVHTDCYKVMPVIDAARFAQCIEVMGNEFELQMDTNKKCLKFNWETTCESRSVGIPLDEKTIQEVDQYPALKTYRGRFAKDRFTSIVKGRNLNTQLQLGFADEAPLFLRYVITQTLGNSSHESSVNFWISAQTSSE